MTDTQNTQTAIAPEHTELNADSPFLRANITRQLHDLLVKEAGAGGKASDAATAILYKHFDLPVARRETPAEKRAREAAEEKARLKKIEDENAELKRQLEELKAAQAKAAEKPAAQAQPAKPAQAQQNKGGNRR